LAPRQDPHSGLYALFAQVRERLREGAPLAWTLRRFERDLLDALGFGFDLSHDGDGGAIDPAARYRLDAEHGPRRVPRERTATGRALLALAGDEMPGADDLQGLRRAMRAVLAHYLGGRGLKSWELMGELGRIAAPPARAQASPGTGADDKVS